MRKEKPLTINMINFHEVVISHDRIKVVWSCFPYYRTRKTEYQIGELLDWIKADDQENIKTVDPFWMLSEMEDVMMFTVCDFHAEQTDIFWKKEINILNRTIRSLTDKIRSLETLVEKLNEQRSKLLKRMSQSIKFCF